MITFTLVAVLGVLLAMVLKQLFRKEPAAPPKPAEDLANLKITDARVGDMVSVTGAGDDFGDLEFKIDRHNQYEAGEKQWVELGGMYKERRVYLEVLDGDELEVSAVLHPNKLTIDDLLLSEQDLTELDQRQNTGDNFEYDGKLFYYRFSKEISVLRDGQTQRHRLLHVGVPRRRRQPPAHRQEGRGRAVYRQPRDRRQSGRHYDFPRLL